MDERMTERREHRGQRFRSERGASAVEYGIMLAAIAGAIVAIAFTVGGKILSHLTSFNSSIP